jgi:hypothetical protein
MAVEELSGEASSGMEGRSQGWHWMRWRMGKATTPFYRTGWRGGDESIEGSGQWLWRFNVDGFRSQNEGRESDQLSVRWGKRRGFDSTSVPGPHRAWRAQRDGGSRETRVG